MMQRLIFPLLAVFAFIAPVQAQSELEKGFAGALRGCEEWVLNPSSWANGPDGFIATVGLGGKMGLVPRVHEAQLPPPQLRVNNLYWRINPTEGVGYFLVVSGNLPMCHITGGGDTDLQPVVEAVLSANDFASRWEQVESSTQGDLISTNFRNREVPDFRIVISRSTQPGERLDRVQVSATAYFEMKK